jgi:hypothetical protein
MLEMVEGHKSSAVLEDRRDLMANLIRASLMEKGARKDFEFTHRDLLGNIFIFLIAGMPFRIRYFNYSVELL